MQTKRARVYLRPTARDLAFRLGFFIPLMSAVGWLVQRDPLYGCLLGAGIGTGGWCLNAYLYNRQPRGSSS